MRDLQSKEGQVKSQKARVEAQAEGLQAKLTEIDKARDSQLQQLEKSVVYLRMKLRLK